MIISSFYSYFFILLVPEQKHIHILHNFITPGKENRCECVAHIRYRIPIGMIKSHNFRSLERNFSYANERVILWIFRYSFHIWEVFHLLEDAVVESHIIFTVVESHIIIQFKYYYKCERMLSKTQWWNRWKVELETGWLMSARPGKDSLPKSSRCILRKSKWTREKNAVGKRRRETFRKGRSGTFRERRRGKVAENEEASSHNNERLERYLSLFIHV